MDEPLPMSYTLEPWDVLISTTIHPSNLLRFTARTNWQESLLQLSATQKEKVRSLLVNDFVSDASEKKMQFLVQFNQGS